MQNSFSFNNITFDSIFGTGYIIIVYHLLQVIIVVNAIIMLVNYMFSYCSTW